MDTIIVFEGFCADSADKIFNLASNEKKIFSTHSDSFFNSRLSRLHTAQLSAAPQLQLRV
jgi:hypothetical protein